MAKKIISPNKFSKKFFNKDIFFILNLDKRINKLIFITIFLSVISGVSDIFLVSILSEIIIYTTSGEFTSELSQKLISSIPIGLMIILIFIF